MDNMIVGNLCTDPTFRQTRRGGRPMARLLVAVSRRRRSGDALVELPSVFHRVLCYGGLADNVSNTLRKGMEVLVVGEWVDDSYTDDQGQRHSQIALEARVVGPGLRWATATVVKVDRIADVESITPGTPAVARPERDTAGREAAEPALARAG
ncbi:MAG TPA: single-stranded DNA-binding protein [Pseudonocardiaceae bacterium]|nr:single-stranded DNA-binding protein [Pseudonocardiaceae bacterium]